TGIRASRARARRYPDHDGRRRCRRPLVLHPVLEPRSRLDHAAQRDRHAEVKEEFIKMQLYAPTSTTPKRKAFRAPALASLQGTRIGVLENGKLNAEEMLNEVAQLFVQ